MICINCLHSSTQIINSRPKKKQPLVWRRRQCSRCHATFTTYERPSLAENRSIYLASGESIPFNLGRLTLSIARAFTHAPKDAKNNALWLAQSVEDILSTQRESIAPKDIEATTYEVLKRYDKLAGLQYAVQHQLITLTKKQRGRPSWRERE